MIRGDDDLIQRLLCQEPIYHGRLERVQTAVSEKNKLLSELI